MSFDLEAVRSRIPALARSTYLNAGGIGPTPLPVTETLIQLATEISQEGPGGMAFSLESFTRADATRRRVAAFFGVESDEISLLRSTADGFNVVGHGLRWKPGDEVIYGADDHPAARAVWAVLARRYDVHPVPVSLPDGDEQAILEAVRARITPRTRLLSLSHDNSEHGLCLPARALADLADRHGALLMLDGCQAVGQFPIDLRELDCDFFAAGAYKWLLAPFGTAVLYLRHALLPLVETSWAGASKAVRFDPETALWETETNGEKYEFGARYWPLVPAMAAAIDFVDSVGLPQIQRRSRALVHRMCDRLESCPRIVNFTPRCEYMRTGMVGVAVDGMAGAEVAERLNAQGVGLRANRGPNGVTGVRLCLAFFTSEEEVDQTAELLRSFAENVS